MKNKPKSIFLVDDSITNLTIGKNALIEKYNVFTIPSGKKLLEMLELTKADLILLDIEMPEMNGYDVIKILKSNKETADIPVIFLTARCDAGSELEGLTLGAIDYITKPFSPQLLLKRIDVHLLVEQQRIELERYNNHLNEMVEEKTKLVLDLQNAILKTIAELVECRDETTGGHIERTQRYLRILLEALEEKEIYKDEISTWDKEFFLQSSQLHDVGKIAIPDNILNKPDRLTNEEFEIMKTHTTFGAEVIERILNHTAENLFLEHAKLFAGTHHEKWDGSGYPDGLSREEIPLQGRLMAIADVYDALISERPYKKPFSHEDAVKIIAQGRGTHFDPALVDVFIKHENDFQEISMSLVHEG